VTSRAASLRDPLQLPSDHVCSPDPDLVREDDGVYPFLPLAHALGLIVQLLVLDVGATLAYSAKDPKRSSPT
jgi:hypothetical protein